MYLLGEHKHILNVQFRPVVEDRRSVQTAEYLMLVGYDNFGVDLGGAVKDRLKIHLEPAVG